MRFQRYLTVVCFLTVCLLAGGVFTGAGEDEDNHSSLGDALKDGKFKVDLRYRWENVDDDGVPADGDASTLRTAVSYRSGLFYNFKATFQLEHVTDIGANSKHNNIGAGSLANGVMGRPVIADPEITEVNQAFLEYHAPGGTTLAAGRQEFKLADQRYFGTVGWRQNHQSFEAFRVNVKNIPKTTVTYAFLNRSNRINGGEWEQESHVLDIAIKACKQGTLAPYYYEQDFDSQAGGASASTTTIGARWDASAKAGDWKLPYHLEYAQQKDTGNNPNNLDAHYYRAYISGNRGGLRLKLGYEMLGGDSVDGKFETPQATLHAFNGWADRFLRTPDNGLTDLAATVGYVWSEQKIKTSLTYHVFGSDSAGPDHGNEIDGMVGWTSNWGQSFNAKFAVYQADSLDVLEDVTKFWVWSGYSF